LADVELVIAPPREINAVTVVHPAGKTGAIEAGRRRGSSILIAPPQLRASRMNYRSGLVGRRAVFTKHLALAASATTQTGKDDHDKAKRHERFFRHTPPQSKMDLEIKTPDQRI
jgi:hypothetical protein